MRWFSRNENVGRKLSDLKLAPEFWCKLGIHKYDRWEAFIAHDVPFKPFMSFGDEYVMRRETVFRRQCVCCHLPSYKKTKSPSWPR